MCNSGDSRKAPAEVSRSRLDWRGYYDHARGNIDDAIRAVWSALSGGVIDERDAADLDRLLRAHQPRIALQPTATAGAAAQSGGAKSKLALGWPRRRPRRSPDQESRQRARQLGGSSSMPPQVRAGYTECERAVLTVVAMEIKRQARVF